jgi:prepilin-type N-terminal cleavage/methylation domain-containing protein
MEEKSKTRTNSLNKVDDQSPRNAFTLIELMVVIAIIAVLVSILVPSLNEARDYAETASCQSNLHHIGVAMAQYITSNRNYFPLSSYIPIDSGESAMYWPALLYPYVSGTGELEPLTHPLDPYRKDGPMFRCPTWIRVRPQNKPELIGGYKYGYDEVGMYSSWYPYYRPINYTYIWAGVTRWDNGWSESQHHGVRSHYYAGSISRTRLSEVKDHGAYLIVDYRFMHIWPWAGRRIYRAYTDPFVTESVIQFSGNHHMGGYNALCVDGSVEWTDHRIIRYEKWSIQIDYDEPVEWW